METGKQVSNANKRNRFRFVNSKKSLLYEDERTKHFFLHDHSKLMTIFFILVHYVNMKLLYKICETSFIKKNFHKIC